MRVCTGIKGAPQGESNAQSLAWWSLPLYFWSNLDCVPCCWCQTQQMNERGNELVTSHHKIVALGAT